MAHSIISAPGEQAGKSQQVQGHPGLSFEYWAIQNCRLRPCLKKSENKTKQEVPGEMAQGLRAFTALTEDPC